MFGRLLAQRGLDAAPRVFLDRRATHIATGTDQASIDKALGKAPSWRPDQIWCGRRDLGPAPDPYPASRFGNQ